MPRSSSKLPAVVRRLYAEREGVVSFEYVIVAALVIAVVAAVFGGAGPGTVRGSLSTGIASLGNAITAAV